MRLKYSPEAIADLRQLRKYFSEGLNNPSAAKRTVERIMKSCSSLKAFPLLGVTLKAKWGIDMNMRLLFAGNYVIAYRIEDDCINVFRILDGRTNYLQTLTAIH